MTDVKICKQPTPTAPTRFFILNTERRTPRASMILPPDPDVLDGTMAGPKPISDLLMRS